LLNTPPPDVPALRAGGGATIATAETSLERPLTVSWAVTLSPWASGGVRFEATHRPWAFTTAGAPRGTPLTKTCTIAPGLPVPLTVWEPATNGPKMVGFKSARSALRASLRWAALTTVCPTTMVASVNDGRGFPLV